MTDPLDLRTAAQRMSAAEAAYRLAHDVHGDGSHEAGYAWDQMRHAGDVLRAALAAPAQPAGKALAAAAPSEPRNPNIPDRCNGCGKVLLLAHLYVDDGCPCNTPRGVNFAEQPCAACKTPHCVKPGHRLGDLFGAAPAAAPSEAAIRRGVEVLRRGKEPVPSSDSKFIREIVEAVTGLRASSPAPTDAPETP